MLKRIISLLLATYMVLSAAITVVADTEQRVSANAVTVTAGNTASVTLKAENFKSIAALDVYIYYDADVFTVSSTSNGSLLSDAQSSVNTAESGKITLSLMSLNGISGSGNLLTIRFATNADCDPSAYPIEVAIGRAYDSDLAEASIKGVNGSVTVNERVESVMFDIYTTVQKSTLKLGDTLTLSVNNYYRRSFASAEFDVEYDTDIFDFDSVELNSALTGDGAVYSVNTSVDGHIRIAYANENSVSSYSLFTVKLTVAADVAMTTKLTASAANIYKEDLSAYLPDSYSRNVTIEKAPIAVDYPNAFFKTDRLVVGKESEALFCLEAGSGIAAGDFTISYDTSLLSCVEVSAAEGLDEIGGMVVINDSFKNGVIKFSYVNMSAYDEEDTAIIRIVFEPKKSSSVHHNLTSSAVGVVDASQNIIGLEHISDSDCIYNATVVEPTCKTEGSIDYLCDCGKYLETETIPKITYDECTHYDVSFIDDNGRIISQNEYHYGDPITVPENPKKQSDETYTYSFAGWDKDIVGNCMGDAVYTATYYSTYIDYTVIFKDWNGEIISENVYHWGDTVIVPANPTKEADNICTYAFKGWDNTVVNCNGNATYTAVYDSTYINYTVVFKDWNGSIISQKAYHWGDTVVIPANPTREADNTYTYSFKGWDKSVVNCNGNITYTAVYDSTYIDYTVIFEDWNGDIISENVYHWGDTVIVPANPTREADNTYTYAFKDWGKSVVNCNGNITYTAVYDSTYIDYTVIFEDWNGDIISENVYHWGDTVIVPATPTREADNICTYAFKGWDNTVVNCNGNATYTAVYDSTYINYTVVFKDWNGSIISQKAYHWGDTVVIPANPTREADNTYTYSFNSWGKSVVNCNGNVTYTAVYDSTYIDYTVIFEDWNGDIISQNVYHWGDRITKPDDPTRPYDADYIYTFAGWDKAIVDCNGSAIYTATYDKTEIVLTSIEITKLPNKLSFYDDESFDVTGMVITAYYNNGVSEEVKDYTVDGFNNSIGSNVITVGYQGKTAEFVVTVSIRPPTKITSDIYSVENEYILRVLPDTTVEKFLSGLNEGSFCRVYSESKVLSSDEKVGTGMVVKVLDGEKVNASYTIIVTGDIDGNGILNSLDYVLIKRAYLGTYELTDLMQKAADIKRNGRIDIIDCILVKRAYFGTYTFK